MHYPNSLGILIFVRHYPGWVPPASKFSENTTDKDLREMEEKKAEKVKAFKEDNNFEQEVEDTLDRCENKQELLEAKEKLENHAKAQSSKFLEELKEIAAERIERLENSTYTKESIEKSIEKIHKELEEDIQNEGKYTAFFLEKINNIYKERLEELEEWEDKDSDASESYQGSNEDKSVGVVASLPQAAPQAAVVDSLPQRSIISLAAENNKGEGPGSNSKNVPGEGSSSNPNLSKTAAEPEIIPGRNAWDKEEYPGAEGGNLIYGDELGELILCIMIIIGEKISSVVDVISIIISSWF